jgi:hypothetical protein
VSGGSQLFGSVIRPKPATDWGASGKARGPREDDPISARRKGDASDGRSPDRKPNLANKMASQNAEKRAKADNKRQLGSEEGKQTASESEVNKIAKTEVSDKDQHGSEGSK